MQCRVFGSVICSSSYNYPAQPAGKRSPRHVMRPSNRPKSHALAPAHPATLTLASLPRDRLVASQRLTSIDFPRTSDRKQLQSGKPLSKQQIMSASPNPPTETSKENTSSTWQKGQSQFSKSVSPMPSHLELKSMSIQHIIPPSTPTPPHTHTHTINEPISLTRFHRSKRYSEYFDPCQEAANKSLKCLRRNGGDREMCQDYFE